MAIDQLTMHMKGEGHIVKEVGYYTDDDDYIYKLEIDGELWLVNFEYVDDAMFIKFNMNG